MKSLPTTRGSTVSLHAKHSLKRALKSNVEPTSQHAHVEAVAGQAEQAHADAQVHEAVAANALAPFPCVR